MRMTRAAALLATAAVAIVASVTTAPVAALAAEPTDTAIEVSLDGSSWSLLPPDGIFPADMRVSPGDGQTAELFVRSTRSTAAMLTIAVTDAVTSELQLSRDLRIGGGDSDWAMPATAFADLPVCANLIEPRPVTASDVTAVSIDLQLDPASVNVTQDATANFDISVGLTDLGVAVDPNGCPIDATVVSGLGGGGNGILAYTGGTVQYPALIGAGLAIGTGWLLILTLLRRRRREAELAAE